MSDPRIQVDQAAGVVRVYIAGISDQAAHDLIKKGDRAAVDMLGTLTTLRRFREPVTITWFDAEGRPGLTWKQGVGMSMNIPEDWPTKGPRAATVRATVVCEDSRGRKASVTVEIVTVPQ